MGYLRVTAQRRLGQWICMTKNMTDMEELDAFLIKAASYKRVGVRRKIVTIRKWLDCFVKRKMGTKISNGLLQEAVRDAKATRQTELANRDNTTEEYLPISVEQIDEIIRLLEEEITNQ